MQEGRNMGRVIVQASMSLDGFIADTKDQVGPLFDWYGNGDVEFTGSDPDMVFHVSAARADYLRKAWSNVAADVIGRRLFDLTNGWHGNRAVGDAVFVVTHEPPTDWPYPDAPFTFVTDGVEKCSGPGTSLRPRTETCRCLEDPEIVQGDRVTHLYYRVRK